MGKILYLLTPVYVTLFWAIVLMLAPKRDNRPKNFLGRFMLVSFVLYFSHAIFFTGNYNLYVWLDSFYMFASLAVFPMYYIYVRLLTTDKKTSNKKHLIYLGPSIIIALLSAIGYILMDQSEQMDYTRTVLMGNNSLTFSPIISYMNGVLFAKKIVFLLQTVIFSILCWHMVKKHNNEVLNYYSNTDGNELKWLHFFNITLIATSILSISAQIMGRETFVNDETMLPIPAFIFSSLLFAIGFLGNKQSPVHILDDALDLKPNNPITNNLKDKLVHSFNSERLFLDPNLKVTDLVKKLNTNRTYISKLINEEFQMNFNDYVNLHRVIYAKELLHKNEYDKYHLEAIAQMAGFGSLNSFNRAFQKIEHVPPGRYRKQNV